MTPETLSNWLHMAMTSAFGEVRNEWLDQSLATMDPVKPLVRSDFLRAHPVESWNDEELFEWALKTDAPFQATLLYRISHHIFRANPEAPVLGVLSYIMRSRTGAEVYYSSSIGEGFRILHGFGLIIGPRHRIGSNFTAYQGVTLGQRRQYCREESLEIGNDCVFFAGAKILGKLRIGHGVKVAANAVLLSDAEDGATYGGIPARRIA